MIQQKGGPEAFRTSAEGNVMIMGYFSLSDSTLVNAKWTRSLLNKSQSLLFIDMLAERRMMDTLHIMASALTAYPECVRLASPVFCGLVNRSHSST